LASRAEELEPRIKDARDTPYNDESRDHKNSHALEK
jgi:hypothetical protein